MSGNGEELTVGAVPDIAFDAETSKRYSKGRFLGKVRCYVELWQNFRS